MVGDQDYLKSFMDMSNGPLKTTSEALFKGYFGL